MHTGRHIILGNDVYFYYSANTMITSKTITGQWALLSSEALSSRDSLDCDLMAVVASVCPRVQRFDNGLTGTADMTVISDTTQQCFEMGHALVRWGSGPCNDDQYELQYARCQAQCRRDQGMICC